MVGLLSAGCLFWLERLQPLFLALAAASLVYQIWAVFRRPPTMRTFGMKAILGVSLLFNGLLLVGWVVLAIRYQ
jgi:hypothetical protein